MHNKMSGPVLEVANLVKTYGDVQAVRGVSFNVEEGEVFGLLGPNGAGKTTTVEILEGLRDPDGGSVRVCGLDPPVRREIYDIIEELRREKKTILMTTHYIEEAERLCDRVAIVDHGKVIALGSPRELKQRSGGNTRIEVKLAKPSANGTLKSLEGVVDVREVDGTYVLHTQRPPQAIVSLVKHLEAEGNQLVSLEIATPSLEDVFIEMTGRRLRD